LSCRDISSRAAASTLSATLDNQASLLNALCAIASALTTTFSPKINALLCDRSDFCLPPHFHESEHGRKGDEDKQDPQHHRQGGVKANTFK
jgi:hypothetical protein